jgi:hypothetical protein
MAIACCTWAIVSLTWVLNYLSAERVHATDKGKAVAGLASAASSHDHKQAEVQFATCRKATDHCKQ